MKPTFSIIIPTYNEGNNIANCLNSIIAQSRKDWICYICDDNSTDNTEDIVMKFVDNDSRFIYIKSEFKHYNPADQSTFKDKDMSGISNMLNMGLQLAKDDDSEYIIRMDADDVMLSERLQISKDYMDNNLDCDIAGFPLITDMHKGDGDVVMNLCQWTNNTPYGIPINIYKTGNTKSLKNISIDDINNLYKPYHPTLCIRKKSFFEKMPYLYRQPFDGIEDTALYYTAITHGLRIDLANTGPVIKYKIGKYHPNQMEKHRRLYNVYNIKEYNNINNIKRNKLTVILTFKNEGIEVEKTIISLKYADPLLSFVLVDDASDDGYNYKELANIFGCEYYRNEKSLGCAGARCEAVKHVKTPYFILMDAHMRLSLDKWDYDWSRKFVSALDQNPDNIIVANTIIMHSNTGEEPQFRHYTNEDCLNGHKSFAAKCAYYHQAHDGKDWSSDWCYQVLDNDKYKYTQNKERDLLVECVSIMGATYAMSVEWWNKIHGLTGLYYWGHDEPLLSLKTYLLGGKCKFFINWAVGHLYRDKPVYGNINAVNSITNLLYIQYLMSHTGSDAGDKQQFEDYIEMLRTHNKYGDDFFENVINEFNSHRQEYESEKTWLWDNNVREISDVLEQQSRLCKV